LSYLVLARKSRPQSFDEVVGQQTVVRTLKNALAQNRVPHGLIFSGIRGTGKTTLARIMAKALNCEQGPTPTPCNTCRSCREIASGSSVDLHEIDGASNRGIQEIRDLKEKIRFMPTSARFKIIIIDEVHMLTTEAFNALLKTLEEPPDHVYFMFATTELHKVPVTILSRCQRYELQRVGHGELADHFTRLAVSEGISIEPAAIQLIVREAAGSVRDGLSLLDQVFSYCGNEVTAEEVAEVLGLVSHRVIADLSEALLAGDLAEAMKQLTEVYAYGMNIKRFGNELLSWFRNLILCSLHKQPDRILDLPEEDIVRLAETAGRYSLQAISALFKILLEGLEKANRSSQPRMAMEMAFIQAVQVGDVQPVAELLTRLDTVLAGGCLAQSASAQPRKDEKKTTEHVPPRAVLSRQKDNAELLIREEPPPPKIETKSERKDRDKQPEKDSSPGEEKAGPALKSAEKQGSVSEEKEPAIPSSQKRDIRRDWPEFIEYVRDRKPWMAAALQKADSVALEQEELVIHYEESADCNLLKNQEHIRPLTEFALDFFQQPFTLAFKVADDGSCEVDPNGAISPKEERKALARDPLVLAALDVFNGQVGDIRVGPRFRTPMNGESADKGKLEK
jgi:DNA polymerase-3 subunit gamma/tau